MKKNRDDEFDFLEELELDEDTKAKKKKRSSKRSEKSPDGKRRASTDKSGGKKPKAASGGAVKSKAAKAKAKAPGASVIHKQKNKANKENVLLTFWQGLCESVSEMSAGDGIVVSTGILVLVLEIGRAHV